MPKANGVPAATGSVNIDTKLLRMKSDIYSQVIGETKTTLKSLDTQLKDSLDGQIKKAVNEQQDSQDRISQVMSKIKSAIQTSEVHTRSEFAAQITHTVKLEVAKAMELYKESQPESKPSEPITPAPVPAQRADDSKRLGNIPEQLDNLTQIVMGSLAVIDNILLSWGQQLEAEMETKRIAFEEEWRDQIDYTQQALSVQVDNLTDTRSKLHQLSMIVSNMGQGPQLETTDLTDYQDEPPEEVWPGLTNTPAPAIQATNVEEADTSIFDLDKDPELEIDLRKEGECGRLPQSLTGWFAEPALPTLKNDESHVDSTMYDNHHNSETGSTETKQASAPALIKGEPHVDTAKIDRHHDTTSA